MAPKSVTPDRNENTPRRKPDYTRPPDGLSEWLDGLIHVPTSPKQKAA